MKKTLFVRLLASAPALFIFMGYTAVLPPELLSGIGITAYAADYYNSYLVTTENNRNKSGADLAALRVTFREKELMMISRQ